MRRLAAVLTVAFVLTAGCSGGSDDTTDAKKDAKDPAVSLGFDELGIDWPRLEPALAVPDVPEAPAGFDQALIDRMADIIEPWAATSVSERLQHADDPLKAVADSLPSEAGATLTKQAAKAVSPDLNVANVFGKDVKVVGAPRITTAWSVTTPDPEGAPKYVLVQLQTRTAYEVKVGDGPTRVIGVLRVNGLTALPDTADNFGVFGGWQEMGAADCALALDDALVPDEDPAQARKDLRTFIRVGASDTFEMPPLDVEEQVDDQYLKRCRSGSV